jgi:hypothetical protein
VSGGDPSLEGWGHEAEVRRDVDRTHCNRAMSIESMERGAVLRVLLMGSSEITFDDNGAGVCLADLMEGELTALRPESRWEIESHIVYQMPNMTERCLSLAERLEPDLIGLWLGGNPFSEETVSFAVYHRSRHLYPYLNRMVNAGRGPADGGIEGSGAMRGAVYRALRGAGRAVIGRRALIDPVVALASTVRTLEALRPRWPVLCRLPYRDSCRQPDQEALSRLRVELYNAAVREACGRLSIPCVSPSDEVEASGIEYRMAPDKLHADFASRRLSAAIGARHIVEALEQGEGRGTSGRAKQTGPRRAGEGFAAK